jgi:hypothetical protein
MKETNKLSRLLRSTSLNAIIGWGIVSLLFLLAIFDLLHGRLGWSILIAFLICVMIAPALLVHKLSVMPPWYFLLIAAIPIIGSTTAYHFFFTSIPAYLAVATIALLLAAEINGFTSVHMNYRFAILLVFNTTLAISGLWNLLHWLLDINFRTAFLFDGRSVEAINSAVMYEFIYAMIAGIAAGILFGWYFRVAGTDGGIQLPEQEDITEADYPAYGRPPEPIRRLLGISNEKQKLATRIMQAALFVLLIVSVAQRDLSASLNAIAGLTITFIPYFITRKLDIPHYTGLTLWITLAIFLHSIGNFALYDNIAGWDNVTHALSASVVAAAGYTIIRAIDIYIDEIYIPPKVLFIFILLFVLASGVLWEIFEFLIDELTTMFGYEASMTQYGINDTMTDLLFDLLGAVLAATWATAYLSDISYRLADRFEKMSAKKR